MNKRSMLSFAVAATLLAAGCASSKPAVKKDQAAAPAAVQTPAATNGDQEPSLRGRILHAVPEVKPVYFAFDKSELTDASRATLTANAEYLKANPDLQVQVTGNCDQRGTDSYNLALGQRRAEQVRGYYMSLGITGSRIGAISYGKEKPICTEMAESCWQRNRRSDTLVAYPSDVSSAK